MKKLLVWGYALQSMDKAEKMGLPRVRARKMPPTVMIIENKITQ